jgi:hypothetical protein
MKQQTKDAIKLALHRWTLRTLRKLVDAIDDRLHTAEVNFREEIAEATLTPRHINAVPVVAATLRPKLGDAATPVRETKSASDVQQKSDDEALNTDLSQVLADGQAGTCAVAFPPASHRESFTQWEARRSGLTPKVKKQSRRRGVSAAEFNHRLAIDMEKIFAESAR